MFLASFTSKYSETIIKESVHEMQVISSVLIDPPSLPAYGVLYPGEETVLPWKSKGYKDCIAGFQMGKVPSQGEWASSYPCKAASGQEGWLRRSSGLN